MADTRTRTSPGFAPAVPPNRGVALSFAFVAAALAMLGIAAGWSYFTHGEVQRAIRAETAADIDRARSVFEMTRLRTQENMRAQCRVLAEDPRLKATLSVDGIDEATVADILGDLAKLRRGGVLMILSPDGRVFAQAGAEELRGLDLSRSSVVEKARTSNEASVGSWVISRSVMDLSAIPIRSDGGLVAYLVVAQAVDDTTIRMVADSTGVETALGIGSDILFASTRESNITIALSTISMQARQPLGQIVVGGERFVTGFVELEQSATRPYLVFARSLKPATQTFELVKWLLWAPPGLVLLALLLSRIRSRQLARMRSGGSQ